MAAVAGYGGELVALVTDTIRGWETQTVVDKLEGIVGRDLQYIRINGTVIGGLGWVGDLHPVPPDLSRRAPLRIGNARAE